MMGVDNLSAELVQMQYKDSIAQRGGFSYAVFKEMVRDVAMQFRRQEGKYYVLLSLQEAEHFRGILHARKNFPLLNSELMAESYTTAAMWVMNDYDMSLLASSRHFKSANASQHSAMVNSFRFVNSDTHYKNTGLTVLLRVLEDDPVVQREKWWTEIRSCRRRRQIAIDGTVPLLTVFNTSNEFEFMEFKAVVSRVQIGLQDIGMLIYDAFRAMNSSNTGLMTCSELYGGMDYLGIPFTPQQIYDLMRKICVVNEGLMSYEDFKRVFQGSEDEMESRMGGDNGSSNFVTIAPKLIPELSELLNQVCSFLFLRLVMLHFSISVQLDVGVYALPSLPCVLKHSHSIKCSYF